MKKDFITVTPDNGEGATNVQVQSEPNVAKERTVQVSVQGG